MYSSILACQKKRCLQAYAKSLDSDYHVQNAVSIDSRDGSSGDAGIQMN